MVKRPAFETATKIALWTTIVGYIGTWAAGICPWQFTLFMVLFCIIALAHAPE